MKTIELNDGEQQALVQLIDIAVKSAGLSNHPQIKRIKFSLFG